MCKHAGQGNDLEEMSSVIQPFREVTESVMVWYFLTNCRQGFFLSAGGTTAVALALHLLGANQGQCASGKNLTIPNCIQHQGFWNVQLPWHTEGWLLMGRGGEEI